MPVKKAVPIADKPVSTKIPKPSGPLVLMSGFLTKRNRRLNRWRQRWWKLMDTGMLLYYSSDDQSKQLGQIDIARSCYDVQFGSENCRVTFPRVAPSCCCFSFTVLKRSYYLYAPNAAEAKKWAEIIGSTSKVLNRMVVAGVQRRKAPAPPGPVRPPSCPPNMRINRNSVRKHTFSASESLDDSVEMSLELSRTRPRLLVARMKMASSVPDYLDRMGLYSPSPPATNHGNPNDRLWLDGSPHQVSTSTFGQTFPSPRASYTEEILTSSGEAQELTFDLSPTSSLASESPLGKTDDCPHLRQEPTNIQEQRNSGRELRNTIPARRYSESLSMRTGKRSSRCTLKNRCSLPIIFESEENVKTTQYQRSISCVPNPLSSSFMSAKSQTSLKPSVPLATRVPVFPGMVMGDLQKRLLTDNLASSKQTQPRPLPRLRARAQSTGNHLDDHRPVPKPRKSKGAMIDQTQPTIERTMSCDFIPSKVNDSMTRRAVTRVLQATSPTGSDRSVSVTTSNILTAAVPSITPRRKAPLPPSTTSEPAPPPRPKRDSGPPCFVPPPPPIQELEEST